MAFWPNQLRFMTKAAWELVYTVFSQFKSYFVLTVNYDN